MWVFIFVLFVILLFYPQEDERVEPFTNHWSKDFQRSTYDKDPEKLKDYFEKPMMNCPQEYEIGMDTLKDIEPKDIYYGYTGDQHRYIDNRYIDWTKIKDPMPVYADFFMWDV